MAQLTDYQAKHFAHELSRSYANDHVGRLAGVLYDAQVEPKPHQIDAALFALQTPFLRGVILADEVGLGKTIEAGIVITQFWSERKRNILIVTPSSLRQQWRQELQEKFLVPASLLDITNMDALLAPKIPGQPQVVICSYDFAVRQESKLLRQWDLVVADEAHHLRNYHMGKSKRANSMGNIFALASKSMLLTATPLQTDVDALAIDTDVEWQFAESLDGREDVKFFMKVPKKFKVTTPVGDNPDWAKIKEVDGVDKIYMIRETKVTQQCDFLGPSEGAKVDSAKRRFKAIGICYEVSAPKNWTTDGGQ